MGGKTSTSTSQVTVPPQVLAQYESVNAKANATANTPFQDYTGQFVAPVNATQQAGITQTSDAANEAQPYYTQAQSQLDAAQNSTTPYYGAATSDVTNAQNTGTGLAAASLGSLNGASTAAAPLNASAGSNFTSAYAGAQPYNGAATGLAAAGAQAVDPSQLNAASIDQYLSPYLNTVLGSESALLNQNNQQQQAGQLGNAITSGAFGGDRAGIAAANLEQQQNLANANIYGNILNTGYNNALSTAQQQQGVGLAAGQANRAALQTASGQIQSIGQQGYEQGMGLGAAQQGLAQQDYTQGANTAAQEAALGQQQYAQGLGASEQQAQLGQDIYNTGAATSAATAGLGAGAQSAALQGASAQTQAGTLQQQTQQAQDTAQYNQFLQQQSYPFQVDQFLANIAEGTGALSGSTTTSTQPTPGLFSDERLKEDIEKVGKTFDGQNIIKFRYKGDPTTHIGFSAQEVEKHHPKAVGLAAGYKTVDYDEATKKSADRGHFQRGGLAGTNDNHEEQRRAYAYGGYPILPGMTYGDLAALEQQQQMYAPYSQQGGLYGSPSGGSPHGGSSYVPAANLPVSHLAVAQPMQQSNQQSGVQDAQMLAKFAEDPMVQKSIGGLGNLINPQTAAPVTSDPNQVWSENPDLGPESVTFKRGGNVLPFKRGGLAAREHFDEGGFADPQNDQTVIGGPDLGIPDDNPHAQLIPAKTPAPQQSGGLGSILGLAKDAMAFIPGLASGGAAGRQGFDSGGTPDDGTGNYPSGWDQIQGLLATIGQKDAAFDQKYPAPQASPAQSQANVPTTLASAIPQTAPAANSVPTTLAAILNNPAANDRNSLPSGKVPPAPARGLAGASSASPAPYQPAVGLSDPASIDAPNAQSIASMMNSGIPQTAVPDDALSANAGSIADAMQNGIPRDQIPGGSPPITNHSIQLPAGGLSPSAVTPTPVSGAQPQSGGLGVAVQDAGRGAEAIGHGIEGAFGHVGSFLSNPSNIPAILEGIAAAATAPTTHPFTALMYGMGEGAKAYLNNQQQTAGIAAKQAEVGQIGANTFGAYQNQLLAQNKMLVEDPNGPVKLQGKSYRVIPVGSAISTTPFAAPGTAATPEAGAAPGAAHNYTYLGPTGQRSVQTDPQRAFSLSQPELAAQSTQMDKILADGDTAASVMPQYQRWAAALSGTQGTAAQGGAYQDVRQEAVNIWNTAASALAGGDPKKAAAMQLDGLNDAQIATKLSTGQAAGLEADLGQRSFGALTALLKGTPNPQMQTQAALTLVADKMADNQRTVDQSNYMKEYMNTVGQEYTPSMSRNFYAQDAVNAFNQDYSPARYEAERQPLEKIIAAQPAAPGQPSPYMRIATALQNPDPKVRQANERAVDAKYGPGFHAYFTGSRGYE